MILLQYSLTVRLFQNLSHMPSHPLGVLVQSKDVSEHSIKTSSQHESLVGSYSKLVGLETVVSSDETGKVVGLEQNFV